MNRDVHVVIDHPNRRPEDDAVMGESVFGSDDVHVLPRTSSLLDVLVRTGIFKSKNEARRNWNRGFLLKEGFQEFLRIGKLKRNLFILKLPDNFMGPEASRKRIDECERGEPIPNE